MAVEQQNSEQASTVLELRSISKVFKNDLLKAEQVVIDRLSLTFCAGRCTGLLGHNGAGKTTTMRMILGLIRPDTGQILYSGRPLVREDKYKIGYMPETNRLPRALTPLEILSQQIRIYAPGKLQKTLVKKLAEDQLDKVGLKSHSEKRVRYLSKGMCRRLAFALATIHSPKVLILDEPFSGLDPLGRRKMLNWIEEEKDKGVSIILCTHELLQIQSLCDEFHILNQGQLVLSTSEPTSEVQAVPGQFDWRHRYNLNLSGTDSDSLTKIGKKYDLLPWHGIKQEGYLTILGFSEYPEAAEWLKASLLEGLVVVRFGDESYIGEEELLPYFEGENL
jgi:ABC-2 type transport system ATP-binding protein